MDSFQLSWAEFKAFVDLWSIKALIRFTPKTDGAYRVIWLVLDGTTFQVLNLSDSANITEFEATYKPAPSAALAAIPRDSDGSFINRTKTTKTGWHFEPRSIKWKTGLAGSLHNKNYLDADLADVTVQFLDDTNTPLVQGGGELNAVYQARLDLNCVVTVMDWWPTFDQDPISGVLWVKGVTAASAYLYALIAPDIPANLGGSVPLNNGGLDLSFFYDSGTLQNTGLFKSDGRGVKTLLYDPVYKSNKLRVWIRHPLAYRAHLQLTYEGFKG